MFLFAWSEYCCLLFSLPVCQAFCVCQSEKPREDRNERDPTAGVWTFLSCILLPLLFLCLYCTYLHFLSHYLYHFPFLVGCEAFLLLLPLMCITSIRNRLTESILQYCNPSTNDYVLSVCLKKIKSSCGEYLSFSTKEIVLLLLHRTNAEYKCIMYVCTYIIGYIYSSML